MDFIGDAHYWNEKFINRSDMPLEPEKTLVENIQYLKRGSVLDIACGDGRNALFLAEKGFDVTGIDFSSEALKRLNKFAKRAGHKIDTKEVDLSKSDSLEDIGVFDNILINHYKLNEKQLLNLYNHLVENGVLFICSFGHKHKTDYKIKAEYLIHITDFEDINREFELIKYIEAEDDRGFFETYIFKKC